MDAESAATRLRHHASVIGDFDVYELLIPRRDQVRAKLTQHDRAVLAECDSPDATIADRLLGLELLVRRIEEAS
jgi:hypothetical protein